LNRRFSNWRRSFWLRNKTDAELTRRLQDGVPVPGIDPQCWSEKPLTERVLARVRSVCVFDACACEALVCMFVARTLRSCIGLPCTNTRGCGT